MSHESEPLDSLERDRRLLAACERFEEAWRGGQPPAIEQFLEAEPESLRPQLMSDLIAIELELRRKRGEQPNAREYESRFPSLVVRAPDLDAESTGVITGPYVPTRETVAPREMGRYVLQEELGRGGFGVVYRAWDSVLKRPVALKLLRGGLDKTQWLDRFRREALVLARMDHPNIVRVHECGDAAGLSYLAMELVKGPTLAARLHDGPMSPQEAARLVETVAETVAYAHHQGIIHRDLKPSNILLDAAGVPKVTDFFLAKQEDHEDQTQSGVVVGTPTYMAPEQTVGRTKLVGPAADVWALGVILYQCLTGKLPFQAESSLAVLDAVRTREPLPPRLLVPGVPRDLETICLKCLHKEPSKRYPTAEALAEDVRRFRHRLPVTARRVGRGERAWRFVRRRPMTVLLALAVVLGGLAAAGAYRAQRALAHAERVAAARLAVLEGRCADAAELYDAAIADDFPDRRPLEEERFRYCLSRRVVGAVTLVGLASDPSVGPLLAVPSVSESSLP